MLNFSQCIAEYRKQLEGGCIGEAYRGLMEFMIDLKTHFKRNFPGYEIPSNLYQGYLDMTYFAVIPPSLKTRKLKIAVVFIHRTASFEVWLVGANRDIQSEYWELMKVKNWPDYRLTPPGKGVDSILAYGVAPKPDFDNLDALSTQIVSGVSKFISDIEIFLSRSSS
jgi:hypothetical protein